MRLLKLTLLGLAGILPAWCQTVTVVPSSIAGIELTGSQELRGVPDGTSSPQDSGSQAAWLPFTVTLRNNSPLPVVAYHVLWMADGRHIGFGMVSSKNPDGSSLKPGASLRLTPVPSPLLDAALGGVSQSLLASLHSAGVVTISVDSVIFVDGTFNGPDVGHNFEKDAASFAGRRAVDAQVQADAAAGKSFDDIAVALAGLANRQPDGHGASSDWTADARAKEARLLLRHYQRSGGEAVLALVQQDLRRPEIVVHR